jgi:GNAT superfamily N-acetyltransferase
MDTTNFHYNDAYREEVRLKDGTPIVLRTVLPQDKELIRRGFERLSPKSRYLRFFTSKQSLTDKELKRLTEVDGVNHYAIGAAMAADDGNLQGMGIARFIRTKHDPEVAEAAIAVVDDYHGRGLGTLLLQRIIAAAYERGIKRFVSEVLYENVRMKKIIDELSESAHFSEPDCGVVEAEFPLEDVMQGQDKISNTDQSAIQNMLSHAARENVIVQLRKQLKKLTDKLHPE